MYQLLLLLISVCLILPGCWQRTEQSITIETGGGTELISEEPMHNTSLYLENLLNGSSATDRLNEIISKGSVVVDFYATWCSPCQMMSPIIDQLAQEYEGKVQFVKVDIDKFKDLSDKFNVKGVPQFYLFKDNVEKDQFAGGRDKATFQKLIAKAFNI